MNSEIHGFDLRPNKLLLDPSFEGYKLSLDRIPTYRKSISSGVHRARPADNQFSFYHVKNFALHNHLHVNYKKRNCIYYVDGCCKVFKITFSSLSHEILLEEVFNFGHLHVSQCGNYNVSIVFPSSDIGLLCPGNGALYLINIAEVEGKEVWQLLISESLLNEHKATNLIDAQFAISGNDRFLHVILLEIKEKEKLHEKSHERGGLFETIVTWRCFSDTKKNTWPEKYHKIFSIDGNVDYIALENGCQCVHLVCDKHPVWLQDSEHVIQKDKGSSHILEPKKTYFWTQTDRELTLWLSVAETVTKSDVHVLFNDLSLGVKVNNVSLIDGNFFHRIDASLGVWCLEKSKLEIQLTKHEPGLMWRTLFLDDDKGEEITDPSIVEKVHQQFSHLFSDETQANSLPPFNTQELEECDAPNCHSSSLIRLDGMHHSITHEVNLSSLQWLFKVQCHVDHTPAICTRHDVDACVWQFKACSDNEKAWPHEHLATFNAFGYVQASKTHKKFLVSSSNFSYAAICETSHHIYIYRQPMVLTSELKNRSTGKKVKTISKQQLINLESNEEILGVHATDHYLYVLLENSISVLAINE